MLAVVAFVHTGQSVYARWMRVAERIQSTVVTVLFSVVYLVVVPPLWVFAWTRDSLGLRNSQASTYWIPRSDEKRTLKFFQRLG